MKKQVIVIHGGESFPSYRKFLRSLGSRKVTRDSFLPKSDWKSHLAAALGKKFEVLAPRMPNKQNAKYKEWKIWFERMLPFIKNGVVLVGHSLGGLFLAKYLSENKFPKKISALMLVAAPYGKNMKIVNFRLARDLQKVREQCQNVHLFYSKDDKIIPANEIKE